MSGFSHKKDMFFDVFWRRRRKAEGSVLFGGRLDVFQVGCLLSQLTLLEIFDILECGTVGASWGNSYKDTASKVAKSSLAKDP